MNVARLPIGEAREGFMFRTVLGVGLAIALLVPAGANPQDPVGESAPASPLLASAPALRQSLARIARGSSLWRDALDAIGRTGRRAVIVTPDQISRVSADARPFVALDPGVLAEVTPVLGEGARVDTVLVVINLPLIEQAHARRSSLDGEFEADLDRILAHEVYGHAVPYLLAGHLSGRCPDPQPGQRPADACAIQRENAIRAELGLGRRTDSGVHGLLLAWRW